jgi:hypothetical protein
MTDKPRISLEQQVLQDIWLEMNQVQGHDLDGYLTGLGLNPAALEGQYGESYQRALVELRRAQLEAARKEVKNPAPAQIFNVLAFDIARKRQIHAVIKARMANTRQMTLAARNQSIEAEQDLDKFLFMCFRLEVIDADGNLKV